MTVWEREKGGGGERKDEGAMKQMFSYIEVELLVACSTKCNVSISLRAKWRWKKEKLLFSSCCIFPLFSFTLALSYSVLYMKSSIWLQNKLLFGDSINWNLKNVQVSRCHSDGLKLNQVLVLRLQDSSLDDVWTLGNFSNLPDVTVDLSTVGLWQDSTWFLLKWTGSWWTFLYFSLKMKDTVPSPCWIQDISFEVAMLLQNL